MQNTTNYFVKITSFTSESTSFISDSDFSERASFTFSEKEEPKLVPKLDPLKFRSMSEADSAQEEQILKRKLNPLAVVFAPKMAAEVHQNKENYINFQQFCNRLKNDKGPQFQGQQGSKGSQTSGQTCNRTLKKKNANANGVATSAPSAPNSGNLIPCFIIGSKRNFDRDYYVCLAIGPSKFFGKMILAKKACRMSKPAAAANSDQQLQPHEPASATKNSASSIIRDVEIQLPKTQCYIVENSLKPIDSYRDYYREHFNGILSGNFSNWLALDYINPRLYVCQQTNPKTTKMANLNQYFETQMCHFNFALNQVAEKARSKKYGNLMHVKITKLEKSDHTTNMYFKNEKTNTVFVCNTIPIEIEGFEPTQEGYKKMRIYHGGPKYSASDVDVEGPSKYFLPVYKPAVGKIYTVLKHKTFSEGPEMLYSIIAEYE